MKIKIVRIDKSLPLPEYKTEGAVAFDFYSREDAIISPKESELLSANFIIEVPKGYALILAARSSLGKKKGLAIRNGIGILDQDYNGPDDEIHMLVYNFTDKPVEIKKGERIAQGLIIPILRAEWKEVDSIKKVSRGGFGSTG